MEEAERQEVTVDLHCWYACYDVLGRFNWCCDVWFWFCTKPEREMLVDLALLYASLEGRRRRCYAVLCCRQVKFVGHDDDDCECVWSTRMVWYDDEHGIKTTTRVSISKYVRGGELV